MFHLKEEIIEKIEIMLEDEYFVEDNVKDVPQLESLKQKIVQSGFQRIEFDDGECEWLQEILSDIEDILGLTAALKQAYIGLKIAFPITKAQLDRISVFPKGRRKYWFKHKTVYYKAYALT